MMRFILTSSLLVLVNSVFGYTEKEVKDFYETIDLKEINHELSEADFAGEDHAYFETAVRATVLIQSSEVYKGSGFFMGNVSRLYSALHVIDNSLKQNRDGKFYLENVTLITNSGIQEVFKNIEVEFNNKGGDQVVLKIPSVSDEFQNYIKPLKKADSRPGLGEKVYSAGFSPKILAAEDVDAINEKVKTISLDDLISSGAVEITQESKNQEMDEAMAEALKAGLQELISGIGKEVAKSRQESKFYFCEGSTALYKNDASLIDHFQGMEWESMTSAPMLSEYNQKFQDPILNITPDEPMNAGVHSREIFKRLILHTGMLTGGGMSGGPVLNSKGEVVGVNSLGVEYTLFSLLESL